MSNNALVTHIKKFTTFQWLLFIKKLDSKSKEEIKNMTKNDLHLFMLQNSNWYPIIVDLSIRIGDDKNLKVNMNDLPSVEDYYEFIRLYINSEDIDKINFSEELNYSSSLAMSKYMYEQLKNYAPIGNSLGRLIKLYGNIEENIKNKVGLSPNQIAIFYWVVDAHKDINMPFSSTDITELLKEWNGNISKKNIELFLNIFSKSLKSYKLELKNLGIDKRKIKSIRFISQYPIIDLINDYYFIPSSFILIEALTYKIFTIMIEQNKSEIFRRNFGNTFEKYIKDLTTSAHNHYFHDCNSIIDDTAKKKRAEFFLAKDNSSIVIEAKLLHIDEEILLNGSIKNIDRQMEKRVKDAISQIESCFNYLKTEDKYGIIVVYTHIPIMDSFFLDLKASRNSLHKHNIIFVSILDFEVMIHNPYEKIVEYFQNRDTHNIALFFGQRNPYLRKYGMELLENIKKNHRAIEGEHK
ncbi:MAG: hypothetical protein FAF03_04390 [Epsilonproteobacteria bacterium]|nr:hypothetical protein [Campylobacterota bacterium]